MPQLNRHVAVIGPSGSGKSENVFVPWIVTAIRNGYSVLTIDTRGDLLDQLSSTLASDNRVPVGDFPLYLWDPFGHKSRSWNPLLEVTGSQLAQVVTAILGQVDPTDPNKYFAERDHRWLRGLIALARSLSHEPTLALVHALAASQSALVQGCQRAPRSATELIDLMQYPPDEFARATSGLANRLSVYAQRDVLRFTSKSDFRLKDVLDNGGLFVVSARLSDGEPAQVAAATAVNLLKMKALERYGRSSRPMLWLLDEVPTYAARIELPSTLDVIRAAGVSVVLGLQDVTQFGESVAQHRNLTNCSSMVVFQGCSPATAEFAAARFGTYDSPTTTLATDKEGRMLPTMGHARIPVLDAYEIMHPPNIAFGGIAHVPQQHSRPFLIDFS